MPPIDLLKEKNQASDILGQTQPVPFPKLAMLDESKVPSNPYGLEPVNITEEQPEIINDAGLATGEPVDLPDAPNTPCLLYTSPSPRDS